MIYGFLARVLGTNNLLIFMKKANISKISALLADLRKKRKL
jgi:hypothetical protein